MEKSNFEDENEWDHERSAYDTRTKENGWQGEYYKGENSWRYGSNRKDFTGSTRPAVPLGAGRELRAVLDSPDGGLWGLFDNGSRPT